MCSFSEVGASLRAADPCINSDTFHGSGGSESIEAKLRFQEGEQSSPTTSKVGSVAGGLSQGSCSLFQGSGNSSGQAGRCLVEKWKTNTSVAAPMPGSAADVGKSLQSVGKDV